MADDLISFVVRGKPRPQGSTRAWVKNGKPIITSTTKGLGNWRRLIADQAQRHAPDELWSGPIGIRLLFLLARPKSEPKRKRTWPDRRPDIDKLCRAALDALTEVIYDDDAQIVRMDVEKDWGTPGVAIEVYKVQADLTLGQITLSKIIAEHTIRKLVWEAP